MTENSKQLIIFDLDGTLTASKAPLDGEMGTLLADLIKIKKVAIISGGGYPQFETQLLAMIPGMGESFGNLYLLPTSGTRLMTWRGSWNEAYSEHLLAAEKNRIMPAIDATLRACKYEKPAQPFGDLIEDRGSQITFSALGQKAPYEQKKAWDPDRKKRELIADTLKKKLPEFDVRIGGSTSIDITRKGINKAYGIRKLEQYLKLEPDQIVFVGDTLFYGGNDYPAKATGVDCVPVSGPEETKAFIRRWLAVPQSAPNTALQAPNLQNPNFSAMVKTELAPNRL